jgi:hypothetical protein
METTFIYALCDPRTFEVRYVGKSDDPYKRYCHHLIDKSKTYKVNWIQSLLKLNLLPIRQILEECDKSIWQQREQDWINFYKKIGSDLTNLADGGIGGSGHRGKHHSEEAKIKMRAAKLGKKISEEHKKKLRDTHLGKKYKSMSLEGRKNIGLSGKGRPSPWKGKHPSEESRLKMSLSHIGKDNHQKGRSPSEETRKRISESLKGRKHDSSNNNGDSE